MIIQIDTREKETAIRDITRTFDCYAEVSYFKKKLDVGDYMDISNPNYVIDRKQNLLELANNVGCDHERFKRELQRAKDSGIKLDILCEHGCGIHSLEDVRSWENPRLKQSPMAISGERLYKILSSLSKYYGVQFYFCDKDKTGAAILWLLRKNGTN